MCTCTALFRSGIETDGAARISACLHRASHALKPSSCHVIDLTHMSHVSKDDETPLVATVASIWKVDTFNASRVYASNSFAARHMDPFLHNHAAPSFGCRGHVWH